MPHQSPPSVLSSDMADCAVPESCKTRTELLQRLAELESRVATDTLTGLWNRSHFDYAVERELDRSMRYKEPLSLVLFDIDHFKYINDDFGHQVGDKVLRELSLVANAAIRSADALFRWGGEEFAILVTATGYRGAMRLAEALRSQVERHLFPTVGRLTISLGVAEHLATEGSEAWFGRADAMLYAAKDSGRNTVRVDPRGNTDLWAATHGQSALHLVWMEAYESGNETIDHEHRELFRIANELIDALLASNGRFSGIAPAYDRMLAHIAAHFADEEAILDKLGYERLEAHRRLHARLLARAHALRAGLESGIGNLGAVVDFLALQVVARHIFHADRDFFPLLARVGDAGSSLPRVAE